MLYRVTLRGRRVLLQRDLAADNVMPQSYKFRDTECCLRSVRAPRVQNVRQRADAVHHLEAAQCVQADDEALRVCGRQGRDVVPRDRLAELPHPCAEVVEQRRQEVGARVIAVAQKRDDARGVHDEVFECRACLVLLLPQVLSEARDFFVVLFKGRRPLGAQPLKDGGAWALHVVFRAYTQQSRESGECFDGEFGAFYMPDDVMSSAQDRTI